MDELRYFDIYPVSKTEIPADLSPSVLVDDTLYSLAELKENKVAGSFALVGRSNEKNIEIICHALEVDAVLFSEMRVKNLDALNGLGSISHLAVTWNTKVEDLSFLGQFPNLKSLILSDTPKVADLAPVSSLKELVSFEFSGGIWNKNRAISLKPIESLTSLESLVLANIKIDDGSLAPIAKLKTLRRLSLSNQFKTQEYAYLKAMLPETECEKFAAYVELGSPIDKKDVMVVGWRKPFLDSKSDAKRLAKYVDEFEALVASFKREANAT